jgi:hypothetical protein
MSLTQRLKFRLGRLRIYWRRFAQSPLGKRVLNGLRRTATLGIAGYLVYRLWGIGWTDVWASVPVTPWFYLLFVGLYFTLPVFQTLIFHIVWGRPLSVLFPPMLKKRVYNKDVMSYSGEVYLYLWGSAQLPEWSEMDLLHSIKDNAILSSVASTSVSLGLLGFFLLEGILVLPDAIGRHEFAYAVGGLLVGGIAVYAAVKFRRVVLQLSGRLIGILLGLHVGRLLLVQGLQLLQWEVVIPEIDLSVWCTFLAVQIIVKGIPLVPSRDLLFATAGIEVAGAMAISQAAVAGLFVVQSVLDKGVNLLAFVTVTLWDRTDEESTSDLSDAENEEQNGAPDSFAALEGSDAATQDLVDRPEESGAVR